MNKFYFGEILQTLRARRGFTLRQLSKKSGVDFPYISRLERSLCATPSNAVVTKLLDSLELTTSEKVSLAYTELLTEELEYKVISVFKKIL